MDTHPQDVVLAFDVGGTAVKAAAVDRRGEIVATATEGSRRGPEILDVITHLGKVLQEQAGGATRAVGVAMPGIIDPARGRCVRSVNLDVADLDVAGELSGRLGAVVRLGHDVATASAAVVGARTDLNDPLVVVLGTGMAVTTYIGRVPVHGSSGQAGELGHVVVRPGGQVCRCGNRGCLETVMGGHGLVTAYRRATGTAIPGVRELLAGLPDDEAAAHIWADGLDGLAEVLVAACALVAPDAILLAGGLSEAGDRLAGPLHRTMLARTHVVTVPPVEVSELGARAGVVGAAELAWSAVEG